MPTETHNPDPIDVLTPLRTSLLGYVSRTNKHLLSTRSIGKPYYDYGTVFGLIYVGSFVLGYGHCRGEDTNIAEGGICFKTKGRPRDCVH